MKLQGYMWVGLGVFFAAVVGLYLFWILREPANVGGASVEWTGTTVLVFSVAFGGMVGFWIWQAAQRSKRHHGDPPEDLDSGEIQEGAGEYGFFSPHSWWPLFTALAVSFTALGFVFGWWMFLTGVAAILLTLVGFVFEYYRKDFQH